MRFFIWNQLNQLDSTLLHWTLLRELLGPTKMNTICVCMLIVASAINVQSHYILPILIRPCMVIVQTIDFTIPFITTPSMRHI